MALIYIKTWDELISDPKITRGEYNKDILTHQDQNGTYSQHSHSSYGGKYLSAEIMDDGWARYDGLWFATWTFHKPGERGQANLDDFANDYDAFLAWERSIDRRKQSIYKNLQESFRKAYPKEYKDEQN